MITFKFDLSKGAARATLLLCFLSAISLVSLPACAPASASVETIHAPASDKISQDFSLVELDAEEAGFLELINDYRANNGLQPLSLSIELTEASKWMSTDMASNDRFSHTDSKGQDPFTRMAGFMSTSRLIMGENIAAGYSDGARTFEQWRTSSGHNANMLSANYQRIGIARSHNTKSGYGWYWTTDFAQNDDSKP